MNAVSSRVASKAEVEVACDHQERACLQTEGKKGILGKACTVHRLGGENWLCGLNPEKHLFVVGRCNDLRGTYVPK